MTARLVTMAAALALAGCATSSGPPASAVARNLQPGGVEALRGARTVWLVGAISRTGSLATGLDQRSSATAAGADADGTDVSEELERAVRRTRGIELASSRGTADLVLYFEQADRLRCWACRQPDDLWHWWGLVVDRSGRELVSLHGETAGGPDAAAQQFVQSVKSLARKSRPGARSVRSGTQREPAGR